MKIERLPNGSYRIRWQENGKSEHVCFPPTTPKKLVIEFAARLELERGARQEKRKRGLTVDRSITLEKYIPRYFDLYNAYVRRERSTIISVERHLKNHILPRFGKTLLHKISTRDILDFKVELLRKVKEPKNILASLSTIFEAASLDEIISVNPVKGLPKRRGAGTNKSEKERIDDQKIWTFAELDQFLCWAIENDFELFQIICFAVHTGLRPSELRALPKSCLDHKRSVVHVHWNYIQSTKETNNYTKNHTKRTVSVPRHVMNVLSNKFALSEDDQVFSIISNNSFTYDRFKPAQKKAKLENIIRLHDCRHTSATHDLLRGKSLTEIQEKLGHENLKSTLVYLHHRKAFEGINVPKDTDLRWASHGALAKVIELDSFR